MSQIVPAIDHRIRVKTISRVTRRTRTTTLHAEFESCPWHDTPAPQSGPWDESLDCEENRHAIAMRLADSAGGRPGIWLVAYDWGRMADFVYTRLADLDYKDSNRVATVDDLKGVGRQWGVSLNSDLHVTNSRALNIEGGRHA